MVDDTTDCHMVIDDSNRETIECEWQQAQLLFGIDESDEKRL